jgi:gliding motility-associated-like protein
LGQKQLILAQLRFGQSNSVAMKYRNYILDANKVWVIFTQTLLFLLIGLTKVFSQGLCDKATSEIQIKNAFFTTFCGLPYKIELAANPTNTKYVFDYKGESDINKISWQSLASFTFTKSGKYTILQYSVVNGKESFACQKVEIFDKKLPPIDLYSCDGQKAELLIKNEEKNKFDDFIISWGDGTPFTTQSNVPIGETKITKNYTTKKVYNVLVYGYRKRPNIYGTIVNTPGCTESTALNLDLNNDKATNLSDLLLSVIPNDSIQINILDKQLKKEFEIVQVVNNSVIKTPEFIFKTQNSDINTKSVCYKLSAFDQCNRKSDFTQNLCSIFLQLNDAKLIWNFNTPFFDKLSNFSLIKKDENGNLLSEAKLATSLEYSLNPTDLNDNFKYQIKAISVKGYQSLSNIIETKPRFQVYVPNAFSPNNDNINDELTIFGENIIEITQEIFDRNGNGVFKSESITEIWNGGVNNDLSKPAKQDIYLLRIKIKYKNENIELKQFAVNLIR